jgi:chromosome segregation protein
VRETEIEQQIPAKEEAVSEARAAARAFEGELAELRQQLNEHQKRTRFRTGPHRVQ